MVVLKFNFKAFYSVVIFLTNDYVYYEVVNDYNMSGYNVSGDLGGYFKCFGNVYITSTNGGYMGKNVYMKSGGMETKGKHRVPIVDGGFKLVLDEGKFFVEFKKIDVIEMK